MRPMKLWKVTGRQIYGVLELGRKRDVRKKYQGARGLRVREVEGMPIKFYRSPDGLLWYGDSLMSARIGLSRFLGVTHFEAPAMTEEVCPSLLRHPLGIELWTSEGRKALFTDTTPMFSMIDHSCRQYNENRMEPAPAV